MPRYLPLTDSEKTKSAYLSLRVSRKAHRWLRDRAIVEGRQMRQIVGDLIEQAMDSERPARSRDAE